MSEKVLSDAMARKVRASFSKQSFLRTLGAEMTELEYGRCVLTARHRPDLLQQHGFMHAGVVSTLADTAAGYAALSTLAENTEVLTAEFKINLLSPAVGERLVAEARVARSGRTLVVVGADVYAVQGSVKKPVALFQGTLMAVNIDTV